MAGKGLPGLGEDAAKGGGVTFGGDTMGGRLPGIPAPGSSDAFAPVKAESARRISLKRATSRKITRNVGKVAVSLRARRVFDVDTVNETYGVQLQIYFMWELPYWEQSPAEEELIKNTWRPVWVPKFRVKHLQHCGSTEVSYKFIKSNDPETQPQMVLAEHVQQVNLFQPFDLSSFPGDCQGLTVDIEMEQDISECELVPFSDGTPLGDVLVNNCFLKDFKLLKMPARNVTRARDIFLEKLKSPRKNDHPPEASDSKRLGFLKNAIGMAKGSARNVDGSDDGSARGGHVFTSDDETLLGPPWIASLTTTDPSESRFGDRFSRLLFRVHIQRKHGYYLQNVVHVLFGVATLALSSCTYPPTDIAGRHAIDFTVILTATAFKQSVASMVPNINYSTALDRYVVACFYFLFLMTGYHAILPTLFGVGREAMQGTFEIRINEDEEDEAFETITKKKLNLMQDVDFYVNIVGSCVWFVFNIWWHCAFRWKRWHGRLRYLKEADNLERGIGFMLNPKEFDAS